MRNTASTFGELYHEFDYDKSGLPAPVWDEVKCRILEALSTGNGPSLNPPNLYGSAEELIGEALDNEPTLQLIVTIEDTRKTRTPDITFQPDQRPVDSAQVRWHIVVEILVPCDGMSPARHPTV